MGAKFNNSDHPSGTTRRDVFTLYDSDAGPTVNERSTDYALPFSVQGSSSDSGSTSDSQGDGSIVGRESSSPATFYSRFSTPQSDYTPDPVQFAYAQPIITPTSFPTSAAPAISSPIYGPGARNNVLTGGNPDYPYGFPPSESFVALLNDQTYDGEWAPLGGAPSSSGFRGLQADQTPTMSWANSSYHDYEQSYPLPYSVPSAPYLSELPSFSSLNSARAPVDVSTGPGANSFRQTEQPVNALTGVFDRQSRERTVNSGRQVLPGSVAQGSFHASYDNKNTSCESQQFRALPLVLMHRLLDDRNPPMH